MRIDDIALLLPRSFVTVISKMVRMDIDEVGKQEILKNGLYHITTNEDTANKIIESEYLRPATGLIKNVNSYGTACVCLFNGIPDIQNYINNIADMNKNTNPYINPTMVVNAVKIMPTEKSELTNYKFRGLADNAILYEGYCVLPKDKVQAVNLVPDLSRDLNTGKPLINPETGKYDIIFREALSEELEEDRKSYKAKDDYLEFISKEREELGYLKGSNIISNIWNTFNVANHAAKTASEMTIKNSLANIPKLIKSKIQQFMTPKLDMATDDKIHSTIEEFSHSKKNPYRDKKFGRAVAGFQVQGLQQLKLKDELEKITTSDIGAYFRQKSNQIDRDLIIKRGIHGISHNNRVAMHAMIIAQNEGLLEQDIDDRTKDILLAASYYHDIGRRKGIITDNLGPHSKNSARKINKMELKYLNGKSYSLEDRRILQAVVEAHEGKDKNMSKICRKYKISEQNMEYTMSLMSVLKDADALDRARLDLSLPINMTTDLNPRYLRTNTAKQLLDASYQLEELSKKVSFDRILAYRTDEQKEMKKGIVDTKREELVDYLRRGVSKVSTAIKHTDRSCETSSKKSDSINKVSEDYKKPRGDDGR